MLYKKIMLSTAVLSLLSSMQASEFLPSADRTKTLLSSFGKGLAHGAINNAGSHMIDSYVTDRDSENPYNKRDILKKGLSISTLLLFRKTENAQKKIAPLNAILLMCIGDKMEDTVKHMNKQDRYMNMLLASGVTIATTKTLHDTVHELTPDDNAELLAHGVGQLVGEAIKIEHGKELKVKPVLSLNLTLTVGLISTFWKLCSQTK